MIQQTFDALQLEQKHHDDYQKSQQYPIELSSQHDYTDGITYHYVHHGDLELGRYWRNPWHDNWVFVSFGIGDGIQREADTDYEAIALITRSWQGVV